MNSEVFFIILFMQQRKCTGVSTAHPIHWISYKKWAACWVQKLAFVFEVVRWKISAEEIWQHVAVPQSKACSSWCESLAVFGSSCENLFKDIIESNCKCLKTTRLLICFVKLCDGKISNIHNVQSKRSLFKERTCFIWSHVAISGIELENEEGSW